MPFQYLTNIPLDQAVAEYASILTQNGMAYRTEMLPVRQAVGRVTAQPVYAKICAPHYHACAMDGVAVMASATFGATQTTPVCLREGQYTPVDTGDPLPEDCDAVIMMEDVLEEQHGIRLHTTVTPWQHVRQIGEDICAGEMLLTSYTTITPAAAGAMLACGILEVEVIKKPVIGIIPTGDEIILPTDQPGSGDIIEFNSTIFTGMLIKWGAKAKLYPIVRDDSSLIEAALRMALNECDAVILNAGSSAGREDYSAAAIKNVGCILYHGIAIRPGKPAILGYAGAQPILGVPGYPISAILVLEHILQPVISLLSGQEMQPAPRIEAVLSRTFESSLKYREFVRVRLGRVHEKYVAVPLQRGAGVVSSFVKADGWMDIPQNTEGYAAGSAVNITLLKPLREIDCTLVVTGSHDPLIDEMAELLKRHCGATLASSHVGSMGGIFAIKRGEAHIAGIHLLDEESGTYNIPFIRRYFPEGGVMLVQGVQRIQGLMVPRGNPLGIYSLADLRRPGIRYVNRQKGSGTRMLCDYLCKREGVDTSAVYGYEREEFTHTAVAALIHANSADTGLGIYSAAHIYGLDFIPIYTEQYDLLLSEASFALPIVQRLLALLKDAAFLSRLQEMGGYTVKNPGELIL